MGYRRVDFEIRWRGTPVGLFHQRLSDIRWLVGTYSPNDSTAGSRFLEAVATLPDETFRGDMMRRGVPVSFAKPGGKSRARMGMVQYFGPPHILSKDITEEMVLCIFDPMEILDMLSMQGDFVWIRGRDDA